MEKGLFIPYFLGGKSTIFGNVTINGYGYIAIFGNVTKNGYITKMTTVCPTAINKTTKADIVEFRDSMPFFI